MHVWPTSHREFVLSHNVRARRISWLSQFMLWAEYFMCSPSPRQGEENVSKASCVAYLTRCQHAHQKTK